jgi:hypothetical protein
MKVKKLIRLLKEVDGELEIYLAGDPEGNYFHKLKFVDDTDVRHKGQMLDGNQPAEEAGFDSEEEWERFKKKYLCCVLSP